MTRRIHATLVEGSEVSCTTWYVLERYLTTLQSFQLWGVGVGIVPVWSYPGTVVGGQEVRALPVRLRVDHRRGYDRARKPVVFLTRETQDGYS